MPRLDDRRATELKQLDREMLRDVPLDEILAFLHSVGRNWRSSEYARRRLFVRHLTNWLGYSEALAENEADWIALYLSAHTHLADQVAAELGHRSILDRWVPREDCEVRAFPRGMVVHTLAGNVPLSCVASIVRALVTKNVSLAKPAAGDPVTPVSLALSFLDVDDRHPVARATSVVFWPHDDPFGRALLREADAICAWGGEAAIEAARAASSARAAFVPFGPKRSLALVAGGSDLVRASTLLAHDISRYEQAACFSVQQVFVERPALDELLEGLMAALDRYLGLLPPNLREFDAAARAALTLLEEEAIGSVVLRPESAGWGIVVCEPREIDYHPLHRVAYVHPVDSLDQALPFMTADTQTVALYPFDQLRSLRDRIAARGVSRIVEVGMTNFFRLGGAHDGMMPLQHLVRYSATESPASVFGKGALRTLDQTAVLDGHARLVDLLP